MDNDNSINLIDFFSKVLACYKLYIPIIVLSIILGYVLSDKAPRYKTTVVLTDIYGIIDTDGMKQHSIFRDEKIKFAMYPRGVTIATYVGYDKNSRDYIESLFSSFKLSYSKYEIQRNNLLSDYYSKYDGIKNEDTFQFRSLNEFKTYVFWKEYDNQELFDYEWLPVESVRPRFILNMIVAAIIGIIISLFIIVILMAKRTEIANDNEK